MASKPHFTLLLSCGALFLLITAQFMWTVNAQSNAIVKSGLSPHRNYHVNSTEICSSVDIRNSMKNFDDLRGCKVVEGFVQILLFDNTNGSEFENLSFPDLIEITDFLLLYRVYGLRSIGQLFPNLAVIRGQDNVFGYSFVIFEMSSLQEIGLHSLTDITAGLIRIHKNPSLCYVNTIDWELIAHEKGEHYIKVRPDIECPLCPGDDGDITNGTVCPVSRKSFPGRHLCWNRHHCQKVCPDECTSCNNLGQCCFSSCLGGCNDANPNLCKVCKNLAIGPNGTCSQSCPDGHFEYLDRRCVTRDECINTTRPVKINTRIPHERPYKIHANKSCLLECPPNFMEDLSDHTCKTCNGGCKKHCQGIVIDSVHSVQQLSGCTHINGSLEIQIRGGRNVVQILEDNLNMVEVVEGYIKVVRSFPLVSLNFFKSLREIRGNYLENQLYSFVVLDNQNLQDLWNWDTNRTLKINRGKLFFHFNPKLCMDKIRMLKEKANLVEFAQEEVGTSTNGDKIPCNVKDLNVTINLRHSSSVILAWEKFYMRDYRTLLGYVVYSIKAPYKNITLYDGRDACGDGWRVDDVINDDHNITTYILTQLEPYTQYAFYVKTYTIDRELSGAQSQIYYVRTLPDQPSKPDEDDVKYDYIESGLTISWRAPRKPNGNVTHYIVTGQLQEHEPYKPNAVCTGDFEKGRLPRKEESRTLSMKKQTKNDTCDCQQEFKEPEKFQDPYEINNQISFQDRLINFVYIKNIDGNNSIIVDRPKRSSDNNYIFPTNYDTNKNYDFGKNVTDENGIYKSFTFRVDGKTELNITNLKHFTLYDIKIYACREREGEDDINKNCSNASIIKAKTKEKDGVDMITQIKILNQSLNMISLTWDPPTDPNGHIMAYHIEYNRVDIANSQPIEKCIPAENSTRIYTLRHLNPGNYSLRLAARSQAGLGKYSVSMYIYIEEAISTAWIAITAVVLTFSFITLIAIFIYKKKYKRHMNYLIKNINPEYSSVIYVPDEWEVDRSKIKLLRELGQGSFGMVYEGEAKELKSTTKESKGDIIKCAVKTVNEHATPRERIEFLNEASVMKAFNTAHVVKLLGVVSKGQGPDEPILVVMELMAHGDLKKYLRSHRPAAELMMSTGEVPLQRQPPTLRRILQMAIEIADGMAYLAAKKFVHRDLAARNCMVAENLTVKIGDFGMARDIYETDYYRKGTKGLLPVRWMAPESLKDGVFTSSSDVWSYGVVLWEMATLAYQPYQGLANEQVLRYVIDGGIMERPENCPDKLYNLMVMCWNHKPNDRPTFLDLCTLLLDDACEEFRTVSFYCSTLDGDRNLRRSCQVAQEDLGMPLRRSDIDNFCLTDDDSENEDDFSNDDFTNFPSVTKSSNPANGYVNAKSVNGN